MTDNLEGRVQRRDVEPATILVSGSKITYCYYRSISRVRFTRLVRPHLADRLCVGSQHFNLDDASLNIINLQPIPVEHRHP
jgi:hypothetical protein